MLSACIDFFHISRNRIIIKLLWPNKTTAKWLDQVNQCRRIMCLLILWIIKINIFIAIAGESTKHVPIALTTTCFASLASSCPCLYLFVLQPVGMHNWEVVIQFQVHGQGKHLFGDGFAFWYTKEKGQGGPVFGSKDFFTGLGVFFDTYSNYNGEHKVHKTYEVVTWPRKCRSWFMKSVYPDSMTILTFQQQWTMAHCITTMTGMVPTAKWTAAPWVLDKQLSFTDLVFDVFSSSGQVQEFQTWHIRNHLIRWQSTYSKCLLICSSCSFPLDSFPLISLPSWFLPSPLINYNRIFPLKVMTNINGGQNWATCFKVSDVDLPTGYYFGFSAVTGDLAGELKLINC